MKHYTPMKSGDERDFAAKTWNRNPHWKEERCSKVKTGYRKRERAALNRMVDELVIDELGNDRAYWERELAAATDELNAAIADREREHEFAVVYGIEFFDAWYHDECWSYAAERFASAFNELTGANLIV